MSLDDYLFSDELLKLKPFFIFQWIEMKAALAVSVSCASTL